MQSIKIFCVKITYNNRNAASVFVVWYGSLGDIF